MIELRDYQTTSIDQVRESMHHHRRVLLQAPTGAGKTVVAAWMTATSSGRGLSTYFLCHRRELVDQTALTFDQVGVPVSYIAAGYPYDPEAVVQICSVPTLTRRIGKIPAPHFAIWDECHHVAAKSWSKIMDSWPEAYQVGLSATPSRLDGKGLADWFEDLIVGPSVLELQEAGALSRSRVFSHGFRPKLHNMRLQAGDFHKRDLAEAMSDKKLVGDIISHWTEHAAGKRTLLFAVDIEHSKGMAAAFTAAGIPAAHLDGTSPKAERRRVLRAFATGELNLISNVGLFGEGFDLAANSGLEVTVDCVISARPTMSLGMWMQQCGRCLRPKEDPEESAIILDHAGNALRHCLPEQAQDWTLEDRERNKKEGGAAVKECPQCFCCVPNGTLTCPECGYVWEVRARPEVRHEEGRLVELSRSRSNGKERKRKLGQSIARARSWDELHDVAVRFGFRSPRAFADKNWDPARVAEEERCRSFRDLVRLATKRGMRSPFAWARTVERDRHERGLM